MPIGGGRATRIASGMPFEVQPRFSPDGRQIAFARVITDFATFANLVDVFVVPEYRGHGYGKQLVAAVLEAATVAAAQAAAAQWVALVTEPAAAADAQSSATPATHAVSVAELVAALDAITATVAGQAVNGRAPLAAAARYWPGRPGQTTTAARPAQTVAAARPFQR